MFTRSWFYVCLTCWRAMLPQFFFLSSYTDSLFLEAYKIVHFNLSLTLRHKTCEKEAPYMSIILFQTIWLRYVASFILVLIEYMYIYMNFSHLFLIGQKATMSFFPYEGQYLFWLASLFARRPYIRFSNIILIFLAFTSQSFLVNQSRYIYIMNVFRQKTSIDRFI
jgi:hypothetical protein